MKFGDLLRYPDDQGVGDDILFMYIATVEHKGMEYIETIVLRTTEDDDQWTPGQRVLAGRDELIPYVEPKGARLIVDGKDISDEVVFTGLDFAAGHSTAVFGIRDASGVFTITDVKIDTHV